MKRATLAIPVHPILCIGIALLLSIPTFSLPAQAAEPTTDVRVVKYASDETTVLNETTVTYAWMEANLPVYGDGVTHYFHQGPIFDSPPGPWDENETTNLKDKGALKGTDVRDLCDLVGGMSAGDEIKIRASDGFNKRFGYENVYDPKSRQGPMVLCWYKEGTYVPDYENGMQIVFFADDHIFGNWDMHECMASKYRYNYSGIYPSANGLSVRYVSDITVHSTIAPPKLHSIVVSPATVTLYIGYEQQFAGTAYDQYGSEITGIALTWTSSSETVGTVDETGFFTAIAAGVTVVTAESGSVTGTADVTVESPAPTPTPSPSPTPVLTTITVSPARVTLNVGETQQFTGTAYDQDHREISGVDFAWTSENETVGTVNRAGVFAAVSAGETVVSAGARCVAGVADVIVTGPEPAPIETPTAVLSTPTSTPAPSPPPSPALSLHSPPNSPSETPPKPKPTPESPGFGGLLAVVVVAVSGIIRRRVV